MNNCFWGHKWTKWQQYKQDVITQLGEGYRNRQRRYCEVCNKVQDERF